MITKDLIYVGSFDGNMKGKTYHIYKFADLNLYRVLYFSTSEEKSFALGLVYKCTIEYQKDKFKITDVK